MRTIYLDCHATTPVSQGVYAVMCPLFCETRRDARVAAVERARRQVARLIGAEPEGIVFTSGATEANNLAIKGYLCDGGHGGIVTTAIEHKAVLHVAEAASPGDVWEVGVNEQGRVAPARVARAIDDTTALVSVMWANNEIGTIQDMRALGAVCRKHNVVFHTDAAQAAGRIPVDVGTADVDMLTLCGHKFHGPPGVGALYVHPALRDRLLPLLHGGGQEGGLRSGTVPVPLVVGLGEACSEAERWIRNGGPRRLAALRDKLALALSTEGALVNGPPLQLTGTLPISSDLGGKLRGAEHRHYSPTLMPSTSACRLVRPIATVMYWTSSGALTRSNASMMISERSRSFKFFQALQMT